MRLLVQRIKDGSVTVDGKITGKINEGLLVYVGFKTTDTFEEIKYLAKKLINLRIFEDEFGKMNLSLKDVGGSILSVSQFTLYADTSHGNRPSFIEAMRPEEACKMYDLFNQELKKYEINVQTGVFQAMMDVKYTNVGPITIMLEK